MNDMNGNNNLPVALDTVPMTPNASTNAVAGASPAVVSSGMGIAQDNDADDYNLHFSKKLIDITGPWGFVGLRYGGQVIFFGSGDFDVWCAYTGMYDEYGIMRCAMPSDKYYFKIIRDVADARNCHVSMYADFVDIFRRTGKVLNDAVVVHIGELADRYDKDSDIMYNMFMHVYYGMLAEENKQGAVLGKSIKLLGLYDLLIDRKSVKDAADCNRDRNWSGIYTDCDAAGIRYLANGKGVK